MECQEVHFLNTLDLSPYTCKYLHFKMIVIWMMSPCCTCSDGNGSLESNPQPDIITFLTEFVLNLIKVYLNLIQVSWIYLDMKNLMCCHLYSL